MRESKSVNLITENSVKEIIELAEKNNLEIRITEGNLLDNYLIENNDTISLLNGIKRKFIVMKEVVKGGWESGHNLILTDSDKILDDFREDDEE